MPRLSCRSLDSTSDRVPGGSTTVHAQAVDSGTRPALMGLLSQGEEEGRQVLVPTNELFPTKPPNWRSGLTAHARTWCWTRRLGWLQRKVKLLWLRRIVASPDHQLCSLLEVQGTSCGAAPRSSRPTSANLRARDFPLRSCPARSHQLCVHKHRSPARYSSAMDSRGHLNDTGMLHPTARCEVTTSRGPMMMLRFACLGRVWPLL